MQLIFEDTSSTGVHLNIVHVACTGNAFSNTGVPKFWGLSLLFTPSKLLATMGLPHSKIAVPWEGVT